MLFGITPVEKLYLKDEFVRNKMSKGTLTVLYRKQNLTAYIMKDYKLKNINSLFYNINLKTVFKLTLIQMKTSDDCFLIF